MIEYWKKMKRSFLFILFVVTTCCGCAIGKGAGDANMPAKEVNVPPKAAMPQDTKAAPDANEVDMILTRLDQKSRDIKTYQAKIVYLFKQPVLESEALREGTLYYVNDEKGSKLRINFTSLRQDNEVVPNYREEYFFDGVNLTRVEYKTKNVEYRQLTDANKPLNAFELASDYLPIVGFTSTKNLKTNFDISLVRPSEGDSPSFWQLHLVTKPGSKYAKDYKYVDFRVDKLSSLPVRMQAQTPQDDSYDIQLTEAKMNKDLPANIFKIEVPADFSKNVVPFEKENK
jgi:outer membrane lipoprotein-sorting protein